MMPVERTEAVILEGGLLYFAQLGRQDQECTVILEVTHGDETCDLLLRLKRDQVDQGEALRLAGGIGHLMGF